MHSANLNLTTLTADDQGIINTNITLPEAVAGIHTLEIKGNTAANVGVHHELKINYPGLAVPGENYGIYLTGFNPNNGGQEVEKININYGNMIFWPLYSRRNAEFS